MMKLGAQVAKGCHFHVVKTEWLYVESFWDSTGTLQTTDVILMPYSQPSNIDRRLAKKSLYKWNAIILNFGAYYDDSYCFAVHITFYFIYHKFYVWFRAVYFAGFQSQLCWCGVYFTRKKLSQYPTDIMTMYCRAWRRLQQSPSAFYTLDLKRTRQLWRTVVSTSIC